MSRDEFSDLSWDHDNENFDRQSFKKGLSGKFSFEELTGDANTRPNTPEKKKNVSRNRSKKEELTGDANTRPNTLEKKKNVSRNRSKKNVSSVFEKPSALINGSKSKEQSKENKGFLRSVWDMFHGDDTKERKMTISSRNTVEEIKEQLEKLYDRMKEYEGKLDDKSKEVSSKLVELSRKVSKLNKEINKSQRRINMFEKQIKGYESDLDKIKDTDDLAKQTIIDGKIKELNFKIKGLNFKIQEEQKKLESYKSELKPFAEKRGALEKKSKEIKKSIANLKKKSIAIDQKLGRHSVSKESTFEILRRSIREKYKYRSVYVDPAQVSNGNRAFKTTWNNKTYSFGNHEALKNLSDLSIKGRALEGLDLARRPKTWLEQQREKVDKRISEQTDNNGFNDLKEPGGKDYDR